MQDPHAGQPVLHFGPPSSAARRTVILIHGRGDSASGILGLAHELNLPDVAFVAPQAAGNTWYPNSFLTAIEKNEPHLTSALNAVGKLIATLAQHQVGIDHVVIMGFSQGACLSLEFAARNAQRYAAVVALSGGLIGPPDTPRNYPGSFDGVPVFIGCSDVDAHIPVARVRESAEVFRKMGATVDERIYPGMGHTVNEDELAAVRALLTAAL
jgi:predicted esterase